MKFFLILLVLFGLVFQVEAQQEINMKNFKMLGLKKKFKTEKNTTKDPVPTKSEFSKKLDEMPIFDKKPQAESKFSFETENKIDLSNQNKFVNPNMDLLDKLNGKSPKQVSEDFKIVRGNQDFGSFKSNGKFVNVKYRDFGEVDGDEIRVYLNGKIIESKISLDHDYQGLQLDLVKGFNKIEFEALNQGTLGPNTADFQVYDDNKNLVSSNMWNLATGFKASIMVFKD